MTTLTRPRHSDLRETAILAAPIIAAQLAGMASLTITVIMAGHIGAALLGAIAVGEGVWSLAYIAAVGLANALPSIVSNLDGAGRRTEIGAAFRNAVAVAAVTGCLLAAFLWVAGPSILAALGLDPALQSAAIQFVRAASLSMPSLTLFLACRGLSDGLGMTRPGMLASFGGLAVLPGLLWVLMFGHLGMPPLGPAAAGYGVAISLSLQCAGLAAWLRWSGRYTALGRTAPSLAGIASLLRLGLPMAAGVLLEASLFSVAGLLIGKFGAAAAAAHSLALNGAGLTFMIPLGLATAVTVRVGRAHGRADRPAARRAGLTGMAMALAFDSLTATILIAFPGPLAHLFTNDPAILAGAIPLLRLAGIFQLSDGLQVVAAGALRGVQDVAIPVAITAAAYWGVGLPIALTLAFTAGWHATGMWTGLVAGLTAAALLLSTRFALITRRAKTYSG